MPSSPINSALWLFIVVTLCYSTLMVNGHQKVDEGTIDEIRYDHICVRPETDLSNTELKDLFSAGDEK